MDREAEAADSADSDSAVSITDEALMMRYARHGDSAAFESLYRRYRGTLARYLHRNTGIAATGDELFQDVWMSVVRARTGYRPSASFRTWLFTLAHNRLVDHYRGAGRRSTVFAEPTLEPQAIAPEQGAPHAAGEQRDLARLLLAAIGALPRDQRDAFLLKEEGGFSLAEIATITGAGEETVKSRLRYAIAKLREGLESAHAR